MTPRFSLRSIDRVIEVTNLDFCTFALEDFEVDESDGTAKGEEKEEGEGDDEKDGKEEVDNEEEELDDEEVDDEKVDDEKVDEKDEEVADKDEDGNNEDDDVGEFANELEVESKGKVEEAVEVGDEESKVEEAEAEDEDTVEEVVKRAEGSSSKASSWRDSVAGKEDKSPKGKEMLLAARAPLGIEQVKKGLCESNWLASSPVLSNPTPVIRSDKLFFSVSVVFHSW